MQPQQEAVAAARVDVVVVNYETPDLLDECLRSIAEQPQDLMGDVIVVDNSPSAHGAEAVMVGHPTAHLIRPETNVGYGSAANRGVAAGSGYYVLVLNADTLLRGTPLDAFVDEFERHPGAGVVGPRLVDRQGRLQPSCARYPTPGRLLLHETGLWKLFRSTRIGANIEPFFDPGGPAVVPWVLGAALCVRRTQFEAVGGFDPGYFMYYEEVDLCQRLAKRGVVTRYTPVATVVHIGAASTSAHALTMNRAMFRSLARYTRRHGRDPGLVRLRLAVVAVISARSARDALMRSDISFRRRSVEAAKSWWQIAGDALVGWRRG